MKALRPVLAIARLTLRGAIHTRAAAWMAAAVLVVSGGLPFALKGDGTDDTVFRLIATYVPLLVFAILLIGSLWLAASLIAPEMEDGVMGSIIVKPLRGFQIWAGKWLGILGLEAMLLALSAAAVLLAVQGVARRDGLEAGRLSEIRQETLSGWRPFIPDDNALRKRAAELQFTRQIQDAGASSSFERRLNALKSETFRVAPGNTCAWRIQLPPPEPQHAPATPRALLFRFRCDGIERAPVNGRWTLEAPDHLPVSVPVVNVLDGEHRLRLPPATSALSGTLHVTFHSHTDNIATVYFDPQAPVTLLLQRSGPIRHWVSGYFIMLCFLASIAALALVLSTLFSFPVTVFAASVLVLAVMIANTFAVLPEAGHRHGESSPAGAVHHAGGYMLEGIHRTTASVLALLPLAPIANGHYIHAEQIRHALLILLFGIPAGLGIVTGRLLRAREYA